MKGSTSRKRVHVFRADHRGSLHQRLTRETPGVPGLAHLVSQNTAQTSGEPPRFFRIFPSKTPYKLVNFTLGKRQTIPTLTRGQTQCTCTIQLERGNIANAGPPTLELCLQPLARLLHMKARFPKVRHVRNVGNQRYTPGPLAPIGFLYAC